MEDDKEVQEDIVVKVEEQPIIYVPKKMYFWNDEEITNESFSAFVQFVNDFSNDHMIELWLSSPGGNCMFTEMLRDIIEEYQIPIVACNAIGSSAFNLFMTANTKKRIVDGTLAIYHRTYLRGMTLNQDFKPMVNKEFKRINTYNYRCVQETSDKVELTPAQKRKFKKDEDIYFTYEELIDTITKLNDENFILDNQLVIEEQ